MVLIINGFQPLTIAAKLFIIDICESAGYASASSLLSKSAGSVAQGSSVKRVLLKFLQNQQENTRVGVFFDEVAGLCLFIKKENPKEALSCEYCETFKYTFFTEHLRMSDSKSQTISWIRLVPNITDYVKMSIKRDLSTNSLL